jgi:hypothetical protein
VSDTPKTEAKAVFFGWNPDEGEEFVQADFARQLERENAALRAKVAEQGLSLACLADGILGEDAADRSDQTLVRVGCQLAGEVAALRADKEHLVTLLKTWYDMAQSCHLEQQEVGHFEYQITVGMLVDTQSAIDAARKENL